MNLLTELATFTRPEIIGVNPGQLLWLLPLSLAAIIVYKTLKLPEITFLSLVKETAALFVFLLGVLIVIALALYAVTFFLT